MGAVRSLVEIFALALTFLILGRILLSWFDASGRTQLSRFLFRATEPILAPVRRVLPPMGMLDLSPMVVIVILTLILQAFRR